MRKETEEREIIVNGVDVDRMIELMDAIKENPEKGKFKFSVHNKWVNGNNSYDSQESTSLQVHALDKYGLKFLLGEEKRPSPMSHILQGLAGCITTSIVYYAALLGIELNEVETEIEGDADLRGVFGLPGRKRNGYEEIRINLKVKSDEPKEKIEEIFKLVQRRSPVIDVFENPVPITFTLEN